MKNRVKELAEQAGITTNLDTDYFEKDMNKWVDYYSEKFAELIVNECVNREALLGAIARGWCSEKNSHKTMDSDLALAIFDEVERQIKQQLGVEE